MSEEKKVEEVKEDVKEVEPKTGTEESKEKTPQGTVEKPIQEKEVEPQVEKTVEDITVSEKEIDDINKDIEAKEQAIAVKAKAEGKELGVNEMKIKALQQQVEEQNKNYADKIKELESKMTAREDEATQRRGVVPPQENPFLNKEGKEREYDSYSEEELKKDFMGPRSEY